MSKLTTDDIRKGAFKVVEHYYDGHNGDEWRRQAKELIEPEAILSRGETAEQRREDSRISLMIAQVLDEMDRNIEED